MRIKTPIDQIGERLDDLDHLIEWQGDRVTSASKKRRIKNDWMFSFWIWNSPLTLDFIYRRETKILECLTEYRETLRKTAKELI